MDTSLMMVGVSFNSKLVRLGGDRFQHIHAFNSNVSIPNWFD